VRLLIAILLAVCFPHQSDSWQTVAAAIGHSGHITRDGSYEIVIARGDMQIQNSAGMLVPPEMGLISKVTFRRTSDQLDVSGEICLLHDEIGPVIDALRSKGVAVHALESRLSGEQPEVDFVEFDGHGGERNLIQGIRAALDELGKNRLVNEGLQRTGSVPVVDWKAVSVILGKDAREIAASHVVQADLDSRSTARFGGCPCGRSMVLCNWIIPTNGLQRAIDAARHGELSITCIARSSNTETRLVLEGEGDALRLAKAIRDSWAASSG
jgi:hypothetical protein